MLEFHQDEEVGTDGHPLTRLYVQRVAGLHSASFCRPLHASLALILIQAQPKAERERMLKSQYAYDAAIKNKKSEAKTARSRCATRIKFVSLCRENRGQSASRQMFEQIQTLINSQFSRSCVQLADSNRCQQFLDEHGRN